MQAVRCGILFCPGVETFFFLFLFLFSLPVSLWAKHPLEKHPGYTCDWCPLSPRSLYRLISIISFYLFSSIFNTLLLFLFFLIRSPSSAQFPQVPQGRIDSTLPREAMPSKLKQFVTAGRWRIATWIMYAQICRQIWKPGERCTHTYLNTHDTEPSNPQWKLMHIEMP